MKLFERGKEPGCIYLHPAEDSAVQLAAQNLAQDVERVCGVRPRITHEMGPAVVIAAGTVALLPLPDAVKTAALRDETGAYRWEAYLQQAVEGVLYLAGCDRRGAVYAIYDLCERMGVSPWHFMADVPVKRRDVIEVTDDHFLADWPGVRYRGIFLNDEEELEKWAQLMNGEETIGPKTYRHIFELILRLKGNYLWPAMHVTAFNINPECGALAHRMGIVTGSCHCDMLHRSNQNEWNRWVAQKGYDGQKYDYTVPGQNRERLMEYWRESLEQNRGYECNYTIGMRGIHDSGFVTEGLTDGTPLTEEELLSRKRALLEEIMQSQRGLIRRVIPGGDAPQSFVPYKEVLSIYDSGLDVPEDVTLIWVDDNHGYMRRYPDAREQRRAGGHGLYYHSSYWAPPGMSWLFVCSIPLAHMGNELKKCWEQNIRRIWVDNVGALKPIEMDMEYFLRCGWDAGKGETAVPDARQFLADWIDRTFSGKHGSEVADAYSAFTLLSNLCKPEHMRSGVFSQTAYGDEAAARLAAMRHHTARCERVHAALPEEERDAFFQLVLMKMQTSCAIAASYYHADRSRAAYDLGAMRAADAHLAFSRAMDDRKRQLLHYYNEVMCGGKWRGILTPEEFPPPPLELYPAGKPSLRCGAGAVICLSDWGDGDVLTFDPWGAKEKWFDLMNCGAEDLPFAVTADAGLTVSCPGGVLRDEQRIMVRPSPAFRLGRIAVQLGQQRFVIPVRQEERPAPALARFEQDGVVHLTAADGENDRFRRIRDLGRGTGDVMEAPPDTAENRPARLTFRFETAERGPLTAEVIRFLTLNSTGSIRVRLTLDDHAPVTLASETRDEYLGDWETAAVRCGEKLCAPLGAAEAGAHTLTVEALDPYVTLYAVNVYRKAMLPCVLGPGVLNGAVGVPEAEVQPVHGVAAQDVPLPRVFFADDRFWTQDMVYARLDGVVPDKPGAACSFIVDGRRDVIACLKRDMPRTRSGAAAWEAENALAGSENAWLTPGADGLCITHRQAETNGRTGLALWLEPQDAHRPIAAPAPAMHWRFHAEEAGRYHLWLLAKFDDERAFRVAFHLDGKPLRDVADPCRERFHTYRAAGPWFWLKLATAPIADGTHVLSVALETTGLAIDRVYLTLGDERPPLDDAWVET